MRYNPALAQLTAYRSAPPLEEIRRHYGLERLIKLASNECPYPPFPEVVAALGRAIECLNRYPDGGATDLRGSLAAHLGIDPGRLVFGNGSCELLMLLAQAFVMPEDHMVFPEPSFVVYRSLALTRQARFDAVPLGTHRYDLEAMAAAVTPQTRLVVVCNPNNPTGTYAPMSAVRTFLEEMPLETVVVLDEAYVEYVTDPSHEDSLPWLDDFPNLVVLRTFSKIYGLAGLRVGYAVANHPVIEALDKLRQPFNLNALAQVAAEEALGHPGRVAERRDEVARERRRLVQALDELGIEHLPSQANFLLLRVEGLAVPGEEVPQALLERGVMTRSGYAMGCPGWLRLTVGTPAENDLFLQQLTHIAKEA